MYMVDELEKYLFELQEKYDDLHGIFTCESDGDVLIYDVEESPIKVSSLEEGKEILKNHFENQFNQLLKLEKKDAEEIKLMPNNQLLWETISVAQGDIWDGMFSKRGERRFKLLREELERRLKEIKFLDNGALETNS